MSLATFKKKTINSVSSATKRSGKPSNDYWIYQGPYGKKDSLSSQIFVESLNGFNQNMNGATNSGFSLNGAYRNIGTIGQSMRFSKQGTKYRGQYPMGNGGTLGRYPSNPDTIVLNIQPVISEAYNSNKIVKPSVLSTKGMLERRFRWINNGQYPNNWVQPIYTGNQTDTSSQGLYIHNKSAANDCWYDVNNVETYVNYFKNCGPTGCQTTPARGYKMVVQQGIAPYTKTIHRPKDSSAYTLHVQRQCQNPTNLQKPFPYRVQTGTGVLRGGINVNNVANACNTSNTYISPPQWYTTEKEKPLSVISNINTAQTYYDIVLNGTTGGK
jgi:hypothetical protein